MKRLATENAFAQVAVELKYPSLESFYIAIGEGHVSPQSVLARLARSLDDAGGEHEAEDVPLARPVELETAIEAQSQAVVVQGSTDVWVRLARCCTPVPGDEIMGFVTRGQGVSVHRTDCPNARALARQSERLISVSWRPGKPTSFVVSIQIEALDRGRLLGDVATVLSDNHVNILSATTVVSRDRIASLRFTFELADIAHLASVLTSVKKIEGVYDAFRVVPG
jgi:GTP pyrophosphokinase